MLAGMEETEVPRHNGETMLWINHGCPTAPNHNPFTKTPQTNRLVAAAQQLSEGLRVPTSHFSGGNQGPGRYRFRSSNDLQGRREGGGHILLKVAGPSGHPNGLPGGDSWG